MFVNIKPLKGVCVNINPLKGMFVHIKPLKGVFVNIESLKGVFVNINEVLWNWIFTWSESLASISFGHPPSLNKTSVFSYHTRIWGFRCNVPLWNHMEPVRLSDVLKTYWVHHTRGTLDKPIRTHIWIVPMWLCSNFSSSKDCRL